MRSSGPFIRRLAEVSDQSQSNSFFDAVPRQLVQEVLDETGKDRDRHGAKLPHWLVLRLVTCLGFLRDLNIPTVLDRVAAVFGTPLSWQGQIPHSTSIAQARDRLGFDVVRALFRRFAAFLAGRLAKLDRWHGLVVVAIDGTMFDVPDTPANVSAFGRPGGRNGSGGFPKLRLVALVSTVSHFVLGCVVGPCKGKGTGEKTLAPNLLAVLRPNWLLLMDKGFCSYPWFKALGDKPFFVRKTEGRTAVKPKKIGRPLRPRKDWWVDYLPASAKGGQEPLRLRWIRIKLKKRKGRRRCRWVEFLTNLPPDRFPYEVLVDLYLQRWEVEFVFRELKTNLLRKKMFRSKTPTRVLQEVYGLMVAYNAIRLRMAQAAKLAHVEPRELSFCQAVTILQLASLNGISSRVAIKLVSSNRISKRPSRAYPRVVKKPASKFAANRRRAEAG